VRSGIWLIGVLSTAGALALSGGAASAASTKASNTPKPKSISASCKLGVATVPPAGSTDATLQEPSGSLFGSVGCPGPMGRGVARVAFTLENSGDIDGSFWEYFGTGSVHGTFSLTPSQPPGLTPETFASEDYAGTVDVTGGTGAFKPALGKGTLTCTSPDSVHLSCTAAMKFTSLLVIPATTTTKPG
jgi:hypothetical protein